MGMISLFRLLLRISLGYSLLSGIAEGEGSHVGPISGFSPGTANFQNVVEPSSDKGIVGRRRCGAVVRCINEDTDAGSSVNNVVHHPIGPLLFQERCVWVLTTPSATRYDIIAIQTDYVDHNLDLLSNSSSVAGIMVTGGSYEQDFLTSHYLDGDYRKVTLHGNVAYIVIWSRAPLESIGEGVLIHYDAIDEGGEGQIGPVSTASVHRLVSPGEKVYHSQNWQRVQGRDTGEGGHSIPASAGKHVELSSYMFLPHQSQVLVDSQGTPLKRLWISYEKLMSTTEIGCEWQKIQIYTFSFRRNGPAWNLHGLICDGGNNANFTTVDLTLVLVKGKRGGGSRAFSLAYSD